MGTCRILYFCAFCAPRGGGFVRTDPTTRGLCFFTTDLSVFFVHDARSSHLAIRVTATATLPQEAPRPLLFWGFATRTAVLCGSGWAWCVCVVFVVVRLWPLVNSFVLPLIDNLTRGNERLLQEWMGLVLEEAAQGKLRETPEGTKDRQRQFNPYFAPGQVVCSEMKPYTVVNCKRGSSAGPLVACGCGSSLQRYLFVGFSPVFFCTAAAQKTRTQRSTSSWTARSATRWTL